MNPEQKPGPVFGLSLGDVYYTLFRHKWKIIILSSLGVVGALVLPRVWPLPYRSEARLFIRYVAESKAPSPLNASDSKAGDTRFKSPDERGENIINSEIEILTSLDLAQEVAKIYGPEKILAKAGGGNDSYRAAGLIQKNLQAEAPKRSNIIRVSLVHPDADVVQPVLNLLIDSYLKKHAEIHRDAGLFDDFLVKETDKRRGQLAQAETELRRLKTNAGVVSVEEAGKLYNEQIAHIRQEVLTTEADLAVARRTVAELSSLLNPPSSAGTNQASATNTQAAATGVATNIQASAGSAASPSDKLTEYKTIASFLDSLRKREQDLLVQFTPSNSLVRALQEQIATNQMRKVELETQYPTLVSVPLPGARGTEPASSTRVDLTAEMTKSAALESKLQVLTNQLVLVRREAAAFDEAAASIQELQRNKELEEANYKYFKANLEQSRLDEALGPGRVSNISKVQAPSPAFRETATVRKASLALLFLSIVGSIAVAFAIEFYLDPSLKRAGDVETRLGLPLFMSIPFATGNGEARHLNGRATPLISDSADTEQAASVENPDGAQAEAALETAPQPLAPASQTFSSNGHAPPWDPNHVLRPYYDALRDRLITFFEIKNLTHKPKLVAVTGCGRGSGVTTVAAGLAASLSETDEGNVLLVDMNGNHGSAHHFYRGTLALGIDEALQADKRAPALVQENLYVVSENPNSEKLPRVLPKRFNHLVPKMKASDFDYIIFDLPAMSRVSVTPWLSRFMDMVLVVAESEKTSRDVVAKATSLISECKQNIGVVLNKTRDHVPKRFRQDF